MVYVLLQFIPFHFSLQLGPHSPNPPPHIVLPHPLFFPIPVDSAGPRGAGR